MRTPFFVANWKMNKTLGEVKAFFPAFLPLIERYDRIQVGIAPQTVHLASVAQALRGSSVSLVAQNCGQAASGAFTGENAPAALKEMGVQQVLLGHSERRWIFHEDNALLAARGQAALEAGLSVVFCVGERLEERRRGDTFSVLESQLQGLQQNALWAERLSVAYEPVWAIGTGETATPAQAQEAHAFIRRCLESRLGEAAQRIRLLYGGSVKADNAAALMAQPDVDGLLVGGASLDPKGFAELVGNGVRSSA